MAPVATPAGIYSTAVDPGLNFLILTLLVLLPHLLILMLHRVGMLPPLKRFTAITIICPVAVIHGLICIVF